MQNNILEMTTDIQRFKKAFYNKHNKTIEVELEDISVIEDKVILGLNFMRKLAEDVMFREHPNFRKKYRKGLKAKHRQGEFVIWKQVFSYIAWMNRYSKSEIARELNQNHATIIYNTRNIEGLLSIKDRQCLFVYNNLLKEYYKYVGINAKDTEGQVDSKSIASAVLFEK
jgi:hypothetical protein